MNARRFDPLPGSDPPGFWRSRWSGRTLRATLRRNVYAIAFVLPLSLFLGILVTMLMTPRYRAEATVQVAVSARPAARPARSPNGADVDAERAVRTQFDILRSPALRSRVAESLGLATNGDFLARMHASEPEGDDPRGLSKDRVLALLKDNLDIEPLPDSSIAAIRFSSPDPALSARIANGVAQAYVLFDLQRHYETATYYRSFLERPLAQARARLDEAERATADSAARDPVGETDVRGRADLDRTNRAYADARAKRIAAQRRWDAIRNTDPLEMRAVIDDRSIQSLIERREDARANYRKLQHKSGPDPARLRRAAARLAELEDRLAAAIDAVKRPVKDAYETALRDELALSGTRADIRREVAAQAVRSARNERLSREAATSRALYEGLLARYRAIDDAASLGSSGLAIVDTATPPREPVSPRWPLNLAIALGVGLALTIAAIVAREALDDLIRSPEDVRDGLGLDPVATIPRPSGVRTLAEAMADRRSRVSSAYHALRTTLDLSRSGGTPRILLFTSSRSSEGVSTAAVAIAKDFSRGGRRVLLVDANLAAGWLHRPFGAGNMVGLSTLLSRNSVLDETIQETDDPNLVLVASGPAPPDPAVLLAGPLLRTTLEEARERYDVVVVDGPPVLAEGDTDLVARTVDGVVLVVEANRCRLRQARAALARLSTADAPIVGVVLNKVVGQQAETGGDRRTD